MKAASTTKVAPCSACAGPNTAPRNEWAIMMWSRDFDGEHGMPPFSSMAGIADQLADARRYSAPKIAGSRAGNSAKATAGAISASSAGSASSASAAASRRRCVQRGRCDGATLPTWLDTSSQPAAVERAAERHRRPRRCRTSSAPRRRLVAGEPQRGGKPGRRGAGMEHQIAFGRRRVGRGEADAERAAPASARAGSMSTSVTSAPGSRAHR